MLNPLTLLNASPYAMLIKVGIALLCVSLIFSGGAYSGYRWEHGEVLKLQLADAKFVTTQVELKGKNDAAQAAIDLHSAVAAQKAFDDLHVRFVTITKEIPAHVTPLQDARDCISVGLARSLRGEADGTDLDTLQLAEGQSDDDCSDVTASEVAGWFKAYAEAAIHNSTELTLLQADIKAKRDAQAGLQ